MFALFQLIPISNITKNIPGRTSSATNQLIFTANLPALGFNTYYFEVTCNLLEFSNIEYMNWDDFVYIADQENEGRKVLVTQNEQCILQNQVRQYR